MIEIPGRNEKRDRLLATIRPDVARRAVQMLDELDSIGLYLWVQWGIRTQEQQRKLVEEGRSRTMQSRHLTGEAFDVRFHGKTLAEMYPEDGRWELVGRAGERAGLEWGGRWTRPDRPHFQYTAGRSFERALADWRRRGRA